MRRDAEIELLKQGLSGRDLRVSGDRRIWRLKGIYRDPKDGRLRVNLRCGSRGKHRITVLPARISYWE